VTDTDAVRRLFDELACEYDRHLPFFATFGRALVQWADLRPGNSVVDVGAGRGAVTLPAAAAVGASGRVIAVDNAQGMLTALAEECRELPQVQTRVMDAHRLDIATQSVDVVVSGFVLHFLDDPVQALAEAYRVLPPTDSADRQRPDPRWSFYPDLIAEMAQRSELSESRDLFTAPARPIPVVCTEVGFTDVRQHRPSISFSYRDPQHYWDWLLSHGFRGFLDSLVPTLASEFRFRLMDELQHLHEESDITTEPDVVFTAATRA
jgi:SAM-dependent methyltransferase